MLEAGIAGNREEMVEVVIDPLRLEAYNVTAAELVSVVQNNNQLIAAGEVDNAQGTFAVKIASSFEETRDIYDLPIKTNGDRIVRLGDLATINLTFEDRQGTARFNGETTVALQVVKRKGFNIIDTADLVREVVAEAEARLARGIAGGIDVGTSNDQSRTVESMVTQLEGSVLTAIALVMIVVLAALGIRPALLVGFAIPTSFLLVFRLLAVMGVAVSNIVMFGLILAVGMLVDGAIVVVEYADKRIAEGEGPHARLYGGGQADVLAGGQLHRHHALRVSADAVLARHSGRVHGHAAGHADLRAVGLAAGGAGLSAGAGRRDRPAGALVSDRMDRIAQGFWLWHVLMFPLALGAILLAGQAAPVLFDAVTAQFAGMDGDNILGSVVPVLATVFGLLLGVVALMAVGVGSVVLCLLGLMAIPRRFGNGCVRSWPRSCPAARARCARAIAGPRSAGHPHGGRQPGHAARRLRRDLRARGSVLMFYMSNNNGTEFFVESEPEQAIVYVRGRGNLSLDQKDALVRQVEDVVRAHPGVETAFAFAGEGGLDNNTGGAQPPRDTIGQVQFETIPWEDRPRSKETWFTLPWLDVAVRRDVVTQAYEGDAVIADLTRQLERIPGIRIEILAQARGPSSAKPVHLRIKGDDWQALQAFTEERGSGSRPPAACARSRTPCRCPASTGGSTWMWKRPGVSARMWRPWGRWCSLSRAASCLTRCGWIPATRKSTSACACRKRTGSSRRSTA